MYKGQDSIITCVAERGAAAARIDEIACLRDDKEMPCVEWLKGRNR